MVCEKRPDWHRPPIDELQADAYVATAAPSRSPDRFGRHQPFNLESLVLDKVVEEALHAGATSSQPVRDAGRRKAHFPF